MKTSSTPCLVLIAALVREVICHKTPPRADVPVVGLASVAPIGSNASRRLAPSSSTRSSSEPRPRPSGQADLIQALETDKEVTVLGSVEVGELACHTLVVAEDASTLSFITHENESIVAERSSYTTTSGDAFTDGIIRKVWTGTVIDPPQAEDEAVPRTVSMTWGEVCDTETFLLKVTKRNNDGTSTILKTVPCDEGTTTHTCLVEVLVDFDESSDAVAPHVAIPTTDTSSRASSDIDTSTTGRRSHGTTHPSYSSSSSDRRLQDSGDTVIDVMILYDDPALATLGGITSNQMETIIAESIVESNQALTNSEVSAYLNPVHIGPLPFEPLTSNDQTTLLQLQFSDDVADLRDATGADLVQLIGDFDDSCGRGYLFVDDPDYAFSVVHATCIDNFSHTHELGHNLGCSHNRADSTEDTDYAHGLRYCDGDNSYRTLLSYSCGSPRVNYFSNPDVEYLGKPTGTATENNAQAIKDNMVAVSNYKSLASETAYSYLGCFADIIEERVLSGDFVLTHQALTVEVCAAFCEGSSYFGLEFGIECFCGSPSDNPDDLADATCDHECAGDPSQICGGSKAISVYQYFASTGGNVGCWKDSDVDRIMDTVLVESSMTNDRCAVLCHDYPFYGTQNGEECWCGGASTDYTTHGESTECDVVCVGDIDTFCGGNFSMTVWEH